MRLIPYGADATLIEVTSTEQALDLGLWLRERIEAQEVVPAARTVLVSGAHRALDDLVRQWRPRAGLETGEVVEVPVVYDGPDLDAVAAHWGVTADEVVRRHQQVEHVSAFCGFAPGFSYLANDQELPEVPRRATPRTRVEPGAVGLAGPYTGIYPTASPGGWQLVGRTDVQVWDQHREPPALLPPGTRVRFVRR